VETAGGNQLAEAGDSQSEWSGSFEGPSSSSLESGPAKMPPDRAPIVPASASSSVLISAISGKKSSAPDTSYSPLFTVFHSNASLLEVGTGFQSELTGC